MSTAPKPVPTVAPAKPRTPLASLRAERIDGPWRIALYGIPGIGKTTLAAGMPDPIFLCAEKAGADELKVARYPDQLGSWADIREAVHRLTAEAHSFKSLVIDTIDDIEAFLWEEVIRKARISEKDNSISSIEEVGGGFQKGYTAAIDEWRVLANDLERLQSQRGMNVMLVAHAVRREHKSPETENFERWEINVHRKAAMFLFGWCKEVLFAQEEITAARLDGKKAKAKGLSTGSRMLRTRWNAAWDAKNRHSLPDPLPLDYSALAEAMKAHRVASPDELRASIAEKLADLADDEVRGKVETMIAKAGEDAEALAVIDNRMAVTLQARRGA